jgi:hypothetical protein
VATKHSVCRHGTVTREERGINGAPIGVEGNVGHRTRFVETSILLCMGKDKKETHYEALRLSGPRLRPCVYPPHPPSTLFLLLRIRFNNFISRPNNKFTI